MRLFPLFLLLLPGLVACDAAGPGFRGKDKVVREVEGSKFTLRFHDGMVEAIRTNPEMLPKFSDVGRKAALAAQMETGCKAEWIEGDPSIVYVGLSCHGKKAPPKPKRPRTVFCEITDLYKSGQSIQGGMTCQ